MGGPQVQSATALQLRYPGAAGFLFDSQGGGTGKTFDWSQIPPQLTKPVLLAGGLTPENVFDAILATLPWGVDVASGIERAPGIKDGDRMRHFVEEVRRADCHVEHS
jgi:phosphoribosylanthranilate isomerase